MPFDGGLDPKLYYMFDITGIKKREKKIFKLFYEIYLYEEVYSTHISKHATYIYTKQNAKAFRNINIYIKKGKRFIEH